MPNENGNNNNNNNNNDDDDLYKVLGLNRNNRHNISRQEIKKAYLKLALVHHPDKGGDVATFQKICHAYSILTDEVKRKQYDASNNTYETDEVESKAFAERQKIILTQLFKAIAKMDPKLRENALIWCGGASLFLGLITALVEDSFTSGFRAGLAISVSSFKSEILLLVEEQYRPSADVYLEQFIENIKG